MTAKKTSKAKVKKRTSKPVGLTYLQIVHNLSRKYGIERNKRFEREVEVALRRGVRSGILIEKNNKYRCASSTST